MMRGSIAVMVLAVVLGNCRSTEATMVFYYDPDSGNVSFDTSGVPGGSIWGYMLRLNPSITEIRFREENHVNLTVSSALNVINDRWIQETTLNSVMSGYLTIGDILPQDLTEEQWTSLFFDERGQQSTTTPGSYYYAYENGYGEGPRPDEFVYGQPDRPFDNRWDIVDPDELDWATAATLVYDPATGELVIDTARGEGGGHISWFILESEGGLLPDNFTPWIDSPFTSATPNVIGFAADAIEPGRYSAGRILAPGLTLDEVEETLTSARFISRAGFGGASFNLEEDGLDFGFALATAVPEPTALLLAAIAAVGLAQRRS